VPTVFYWQGHAFRFYSSDGPEPPHIHVEKNRKSAKVWLKTMKVAYNKGYSDKELNRILKYIELNNAQLEKAWNEYFGI